MKIRRTLLQAMSVGHRTRHLHGDLFDRLPSALRDKCRPAIKDNHSTGHGRRLQNLTRSRHTLMNSFKVERFVMHHVFSILTVLPVLVKVLAIHLVVFAGPPLTHRPTPPTRLH